MPKVNMTDRWVASVRAADRITYFDVKEKGLCLRVSPSGAKTWLYVYRPTGQRPEWLTLGQYPDLTLGAARGATLTHRRSVRVRGDNPAAAKRAEKAAALEPPPPAPAGPFTFADLAKLYSAFAKGKKKTWRADVGKIKRYLLPAWGDLVLRDITRSHVHERLDTIAGNGLTIGVNRVQALISRLFTLALDRSLIDAHPATRMMKRFKERPVERVLSDDEIRALWAGLDAQPGRAADALRLRLLLGQRGEETAGMRWSELDLVAGLWALPGARTKNGRAHTVPLPPTALALLARRRGEVPEDEPRVFAGLTLATDDHRALGAIHNGAYQWKDVRRSLATRLAGLGYDETTIGRVLNHARVSVTAKHYNQHAYLDEKRRALDAWDRELTRIISGKAKASKVLRHSPRRGTR